MSENIADEKLSKEEKEKLLTLKIEKIKKKNEELLNKQKVCNFTMYFHLEFFNNNASIICD